MVLTSSKVLLVPVHDARLLSNGGRFDFGGQCWPKMVGWRYCFKCKFDLNLLLFGPNGGNGGKMLTGKRVASELDRSLCLSSLFLAEACARERVCAAVS